MLNLDRLVLLFATLCVSSGSVIPSKSDGHKSATNRVLSKIDTEGHYDVDSHDHNAEYDHEAFLGKDEAKTFDQLTPEESQQRLAIIFSKIDVDKDSYVTSEELKEWIVRVQQKYSQSETERQWDEHGLSAVDKLTWTSYLESQGKGLQESDEEAQQDKRRWEAADVDKDSVLDKSEFANFLHPEDANHMRKVYIKETLDEIDENGDGFISMDEFLDDLWDEEDREESNGLEPDWLDEERQDFATKYDVNRDGQLDESEVEKWILPENGSLTDEEVAHLMDSADTDDDDRLTEAEVLAKYDVFVGSQATDYGDVLMRHDEF